MVRLARLVGSEIMLVRLARRVGGEIGLVRCTAKLVYTSIERYMYTYLYNMRDIRAAVKLKAY